MKLLSDPRAFNFLIMSLYGMNVIRWGIAGKPVDCLYWCGALLITATVTWGYSH